ncbi:hypothetical protein DVA86_28720 [Streptomyces armeniacus]|uniref:Uncharacterized protein n=1 Tax=Streptomyces armeniacus TaxID=83291 RepID=A0A345XWI1_9ACTN|nr:hypothetical protein [Streptomyces armeniacus]AXK35997.1 hypothetical protein DVA86_28720 [Streptomyces armeniacus]
MRPDHEGISAEHTASHAEPTRSFYLLEESWPVIGETGYFRPYATAEELHARLAPKLSHRESHGRLLNDLLLGESVNVWTVQRGRLLAGLDVTEYVSADLPNGVTTTVFELNWHRSDFSDGRRADPPPEDEGARLSLDWDGIVAQLPPLDPPLASAGGKDLAVRLDGPHPAPDIDSYINGLLDMLAEEPRPEWMDGLDYGAPFTL